MVQGQELFGITYEKGDVIFSEGDKGDTMYIIQSGAIEISKLKNGHKNVLALLEHGDFFGEMALVDSSPRSATATAISKTRLLPFTRTSLLERIRYDPGVVSRLLITLSQRISQVNRLLKTIVQRDERLRFSVEKDRALEETDKPQFQQNTGPSVDVTGNTIVSTDKPISEKHVSTNLDFPFDREECIVFDSGSIIFRQGDQADALFIIVEGQVEISQGIDQERILLATLGPGNFFGEMALITQQPRNADAYAAQKTLLFPIKKEFFLQQIQSEPELALYIIQGLIIRLRRMLTVINAPEKSLETVIQAFPPPLKHRSKIKVALVSLASCGGCSATLLENQKQLLHLLEKIKIAYCPMLIDNESFGEVDIAFVDGIVRVKEDHEKLLEARQKSHYLVSWGTCSSFGGIPAYANHFQLEDLIEESYGQAKDPFAYYLSGSRKVDWATYQAQENELQLMRRAGKIDDFVKVDYYLPGCPPNTEILNILVNELRGDKEIIKTKPIVCSECNRKHVKVSVDHLLVSPRPDWDKKHCFTSLGSLCMGFITKGGCGAVCPQGGLPCWGCRGPSEIAFKKIEEGNSFEEYMINSLLSRHRHLSDQIKLVMRIFRKQGNSSFKFMRQFVNDRSKVR